MRLAEWVSQAIHGPGHLRFIIQPLLAIGLGMRDGQLDAHAGKPPYFLSLFQRSQRRAANLREGLHQVAVPFGVGIAIDAVVQFFLLPRVYVWIAVCVGLLLVGLPYVLARGMANRVTRRTMRHA